MKLKTFIERPVLSIVISVAIVLLGCIALVTLPVEQFPNIAPPTVEVTTSYPGANAETVLEVRHCAAGGSHQRRGEHDLYLLYRFECRRCLHYGLF